MKRVFLIAVALMMGILSIAHAEGSRFPYEDVVDALIAINNACYADLEDVELRNQLILEPDPNDEDGYYHVDEYECSYFDDDNLMLYCFEPDSEGGDGIEEIQIFMDDEENEIALDSLSGFLSLNLPNEDVRRAKMSIARGLVDQIRTSGELMRMSVDLAPGVTFGYERLDSTSGYVSIQYQTPITMETISSSGMLPASDEGAPSPEGGDVSLINGDIPAGGYDLSQLKTPFHFTGEDFDETVTYFNQNFVDVDSCVSMDGETLEDGFYTRRYLINDWPAIHLVIGPDGYVYALSVSFADALDANYGDTAEDGGAAMYYMIVTSDAAGADNMLSALVEKSILFETEYDEYVENNPLADFDSYSMLDVMGDGLSYSGPLFENMLTMRIRLGKVDDVLATNVDYLYTPEQYSFPN